MITLSNGHRFQYMVASGALAFTGRGWIWDKPFIWLRRMRPELFTVVIRTLTRQPRPYPISNLSWWRIWTWFPWSPWSCFKFIPGGGTVNKIGLWNKGIEHWCRKVGPRIDFRKVPLVASIYGTEEELVEMAESLNIFPLVGLEINVSCPNAGHAVEIAGSVIHAVKAVKRVSRHPIIVKLSVGQEYLLIAQELSGIAEAVSLNSVPWSMIFPGQRSPLWRLEKKVGGGSGGVSGKPAQRLNWEAVRELSKQRALPVIGPSIMSYADLLSIFAQGAQAASFGVANLKPWKPTSVVLQHKKMASEEARKELYHA